MELWYVHCTVDFSSVAVVVRFHRTKLLIEVKKGLLYVIYIMLMMFSVKCSVGGGEGLPPRRARGGITLLPPE